jgi:D-glycero-alpha-D-manno-heptose-7-phosphate kinase
VTINRPFLEGIFLKYSEIEKVKNVSDIKHKIIREILAIENLKTPQIEITTLADIPAGTGLGSSGSFTTAFIKALYAYRRKHVHQEELAELACQIGIDRLGEPIGKQDQYISAVGGLTSFAFHKDDRVISAPVNLSQDTLFDLEDNLLLFFTGFSRSANNILKDQKIKSEKNDLNMINSDVELMDNKLIFFKLKKINFMKNIIDTIDKMVSNVDWVFNACVWGKILRQSKSINSALLRMFTNLSRTSPVRATVPFTASGCKPSTPFAKLTGFDFKYKNSSTPSIVNNNSAGFISSIN